MLSYSSSSCCLMTILTRQMSRQSNVNKPCFVILIFSFFVAISFTKHHYWKVKDVSCLHLNSIHQFLLAFFGQQQLLLMSDFRGHDLVGSVFITYTLLKESWVKIIWLLILWLPEVLLKIEFLYAAFFRFVPEIDLLFIFHSDLWRTTDMFWCPR